MAGLFMCLAFPRGLLGFDLGSPWFRSWSSYPLRQRQGLSQHLRHADRSDIRDSILTTVLCMPAAARARSAQGASQFAAGHAATYKLLKITILAVFRVN